MLHAKNTKPLKDIPERYILVIALVATLSLQILFQLTQKEPHHAPKPLPPPPQVNTLKLLSLGDHITTARLVLLWLQYFDNQPKHSIPLKNINYDQLVRWLNLITQLDPKMVAPAMLASHYYASVPDHARKRKVLVFVANQFMLNPNKQWANLAQAVYIAKNHLQDLPLAQRYANKLRLYATAETVPDWAKQMEIFVLVEMGKPHAAIDIIHELLNNKHTKNKDQLRLLLNHIYNSIAL